MIQDAATKATLEMLYRILLSAVVQLAAVLGKECPVQTRAEHRQHRKSVLP
jgi:hypothetical protein